jgi:hypothetical protein
MAGSNNGHGLVPAWYKDKACDMLSSYTSENAAVNHVAVDGHPHTGVTPLTHVCGFPIQGFEPRAIQAYLLP